MADSPAAAADTRDPQAPEQEKERWAKTYRAPPEEQVHHQARDPQSTDLGGEVVDPGRSGGSGAWQQTINGR